MLRTLVVLVLIASVSCGCPHILNKRQGPRPPNGGPIGGNIPNNNGGNQPNNNGGNQPNNNGGQDSRPPPPNGGNGDRRPRPTDEPTQAPIPVPPSACDASSRYSEADGACHNLRNPNWGRSAATFKRYLDAEYDDGTNSARKASVTGGVLPNPRLISRALMNDNTQFEQNFSDLLVYFGQWLAHDIAEILDTERNGEFVDCPCGSTDADCLSYITPPLDTGVSQNCFEFTRTGSKYIQNVRQQINHLSSFIDGQQVYGRDKEVQDELRTFQSGRMITSVEGYLPRSETDFSCSANGDLQCFVGGEDRASENLALTGVHTLWLREHNRLATALSSKHGDWSDEQIYQEARKMNIAQMQHVIYKEWLPAVIGTKADLLPKTQGFFTGYDENVDPALANEVGVAAFRFGHTLIRNSLDRYNLLHVNVNAPVTLAEILFDSTQSYNTAYGLGGIEAIFMGLLDQPTSLYDGSIADTLQNHLFEFTDDDGSVIALDLPATNINRARDHGVAAYYKYRDLCGLTTSNNWNQQTQFSAENIAKLRTMYSSVRDIDLFVGGLHETPANGALVGPTFACLIEKQFSDLKKGDRFYYENDLPNTGFSINQLDSIRRTSMAGLVCANYGLPAIQPSAFHMPYGYLGNNRVSCNSIYKLNAFHF